MTGSDFQHALRQRERDCEAQALDDNLVQDYRAWRTPANARHASMRMRNIVQQRRKFDNHRVVPEYPLPLRFGLGSVQHAGGALARAGSNGLANMRQTLAQLRQNVARYGRSKLGGGKELRKMWKLPENRGSGAGPKSTAPLGTRLRS
jgi:hypothetical protein